MKKEANKKKAKSVDNKKNYAQNRSQKERNKFLDLMHPATKVPLTKGQKAADKLTKIAGSWGFIIGFLIFIVIWMALNSIWVIFGEAWDPFPFILLNLALSCLAAIQAPIILMSQNRQTHRDRIQAQYDYTVNLKAEKDIEDIKTQLNRMEKSMMKRRR